MALKDLTDPKAVRRAMDEFDELGRAAFLAKYGFGRAISFFVMEGDRLYDSKALAGAAHGFQHGKPLPAANFSGGERTVAKVLGSLGFKMSRNGASAPELVSGNIYSRSELHDRFGGQQQGGIATPVGFSSILIFTGSSGLQHGYNDGWAHGVFCYFGEGQTGDMQWIRGNAAIRDHAKAGKDLLLFQMLKERRSQVKFLGAFACGSWEYRSSTGRDGKSRRAIVFHLLPVDTAIEERQANPTTDLGALRAKAEAEGSDTPASSTEEAWKTYVRRSAAVRNYALARAGGICEGCAQPAPFRTPTGSHFLEVHHMRRLSDKGPDRHDAVAALCPNCHREAHYGEHHEAIKTRLLDTIHAKETTLFPTSSCK